MSEHDTPDSRDATPRDLVNRQYSRYSDDNMYKRLDQQERNRRNTETGKN